MHLNRRYTLGKYVSRLHDICINLECNRGRSLVGSTLKIICNPQNDSLSVFKQSQNPYFLTNLKIVKYEIRNTLFLCIYLAVVSYFSNGNWYLITSSSVKGHHNIFSLKKIIFLPGQNVRIYSRHFFGNRLTNRVV